MISAIPAYHSPPCGGGEGGGAFHLEHKRSDEVVADDTGEIAHESNPCDLLHVPTEGDLLQTHNHYSGCATYDEHRAAHAGTVSQQLPEDTVNRHVAGSGNGIHAHAACHERNIVHDARQNTDDTGHEIVVAVEYGVQTLAQFVQFVAGITTRYSPGIRFSNV